MKKIGLLLMVLILAISAFAYFNPRIFRKVIFRTRHNSHMLSYKEIKTDNSSVWGIDISHHQKNVKWDKFKNSKPHFIFLKATEGASHRDTKYKEYKVKAEDQSIIVGAYHFFNYGSSGEDQAKNFLQFAQLKKGDLPPVLDAEFKNNMPSKGKVQKELMAFINYIEKATGEKPIIYCDRDYYNKYLKSKLNGDYALWICDFWRKPSCNYMFWQRTDKFRHPAFQGSIDYNTFKGTLEDLNDLTMR